MRRVSFEDAPRLLQLGESSRAVGHNVIWGKATARENPWKTSSLSPAIVAHCIDILTFLACNSSWHGCLITTHTTDLQHVRTLHLPAHIASLPRRLTSPHSTQDKTILSITASAIAAAEGTFPQASAHCARLDTDRMAAHSHRAGRCLPRGLTALPDPGSRTEEDR